MKIAYISNYLGPNFINKFCRGNSYSVSAIFKSTAIARALLKGGHSVTIFSPGITTCNRLIKSFSEIIEFPEGNLLVNYSPIISIRRFSVINSFLLWYHIKKEKERSFYQILIYYNITLDAGFCISLFNRSLKVLEYEDNIFNKALKGEKNKYEWFKSKLFKNVIKRTDAAIIVGKGMLSKNEVKARILIPGAINDDVLKNINYTIKTFDDSKTVKLLLAGGLHYSKGPDLILKALEYIEFPCELYFYGNGELDSDAVKLLPFVPKKHKVIFGGFIQHDKLLRIMTSEAHILLNSTRNMGVEPNSEGFPFKMIEYASTGKPIVSSRIGKLDEEFNKLITFYENELPKSIADAITYVIVNYKECARKSQLLQNMVVNKYSIERISLGLNDFINKLVKSSDES